MAVDETSGVTPSERYLGKLCKKSFLTLWSYPNLFRNQGKVGGKGDGKELCDLLVICGDDIIIFSDKSCAYPNTGKEDVDWGRWFRRSVRDSAKQVFGAERWLKSFPSQIYVDRACTQKLPIEIPHGPSVRYHRIVVALGAKARCKRKFPAGSGSLILLSSVKGEAAHTESFVIGQVAPEKGYVHVFDDVTLDIALGHLDTITDFVRYLTSKEALLSTRELSASGEEDLIGCFLQTADETGRHYFNVPAAAGNIVLGEGYWTGITSDPKFIAKQAADRPSYLWDAIIEEFTRHLLGKTLRPGKHKLSDTERMARTEHALRYMAMETRFGRRLYGDSLIDARGKTRHGQVLKRRVPSITFADTLYVFMIAHWDGSDVESYRKKREDHLNQYCFVLAEAYRQYKRIIGIATESDSDHGESHDIIHAEYGEWTPEMEATAKELREARGWLTPEKTKMQYQTYYEYPPVPLSVRDTHCVGTNGDKTGRNEACPCGSGKKYKKCCMRR
jgi:hypothetical protein